MTANKYKFATFLFYSMLQSSLQIWIFELIAGIGEPFRHNPRRVKEQGIAHLSKYHMHGKFGQREKSRPIEHAAERLGELLVSDRIWRSIIDGSANVIMLDSIINDPNDIVERDPTYPLIPITDYSAYA